jgi:SAM-dependent methyltransferase
MMLAGTGSALLLATTNEVCQNLTVVPLLWVLPLAIYLISFIICFDHERWYRRGIFLPLLGIGSVGLALLANDDGIDWINIGFYVIALAAGTMVCHGELYRRKPPPRDLTRFYLAVAAGGALGGIFVGAIAPRVFPSYWEYPLSLVATGILAFRCVLGRRLRPPAGLMSRLGWASALLTLVGVTIALTWSEAQLLSQSIVTSRTFFGVNRISTLERPTGPTRILWNGRIAHGSQFTDPSKRREPTSYFGRNSGVGVALARYRALMGDSKRGLRVGIVGLGTGTLAAYGQAGDVFRFYEIDTEVQRLAQEYFTYLEDSEATIEIVLGDARLTLDREKPTEEEKYDLLIMDSFSGDAVPVHLLTREAYQIYLDHLRPDGVLVFQVSNRYLNLSQVVRGLAAEFDHQAVRVMTTGDSYLSTRDAWYVLATNNQLFLEDRAIRAAMNPWSEADPDPLVWTDDSANIWSVVINTAVINHWESAPNLGHFIVDRGNFFSDTEEVRVTAICRGLYGDSHGTSAVIVVSTEEMRPGGAAPGPFQEFTTRLYEKLGLDASTIDRGVLIFVSKNDQRVEIHLGDQWPNGLRRRIEKLFRDTAIAGLSRGQGPDGILEFVRSLDRLIREDLYLR